ncbi:DUF3168 domain-containing protein [Palleronia abyssalis]|uniref:DUF3168 domain-containing protein n=1 Tax=Palleronia abyssalis TaxID=1501240 RepID=A0A2R8BQQ0_9RHOB|nr:DUF3168 domain-containing protein [Palleronia abyssalis]SPJ22428.1 hypothetical protein PAA8504_00221 [Palleronia abyssalis]
MSYAVASALQAALYERLTFDDGVYCLVKGAVYDGIPPGAVPPLYVSIGEEKVIDRSDADGAGALHDFTVSVVSDANGFATAKLVAGAVSDALLRRTLILERGYLVGLWFRQAVAKRVVKTGTRRIDLRFRAQVQDN